MNVGGLFSGIGGIERGLEAAGMHIDWHAESDEYCRRVLKRHWPDAWCFDSVERAGKWAPRVDVLVGGFPCQHISQAAARSERGEGWLWPVFFDTIVRLRPHWVIIENVEALRYGNRGLSEVLGDLASLGFDAEWRVVRASDFGAPHKRARLWVVAYSNQDGKPARAIDDETPILSEPFPTLPYWGTVPNLRVAHGFSDRVQRRHRLGNAVMPAMAEWIGRCVIKAAS